MVKQEKKAKKRIIVKKTVILSLAVIFMLGATSCRLIHAILPSSAEDTKLYNAICNRNVEATREAIDSGANINQLPLKYRETIEGNGILDRSPLRIAIVHSSYSNYKIAKELVFLGADVNYVDSSEISHLMYSAELESVEFVEFLLDHGADVHYVGQDQNTALDFAIHATDSEYFSIPMVRLLLERGSPITPKTIKQTLKDEEYYTDWYEIIAELVGKTDYSAETLGIHEMLRAAIGKEDDRVRDYFESKNTFDHTDKVMVMYCAANNSINAIEAYISRGGDINTIDDYGNSLLMIAARYGAEEVLDYLLQKGADINRTTSVGETAISQASLYGQTDAALKLLAHTDKIYGQLKEGWTIEYIDNVYINAARNGDVTLAKAIAEKEGEMDPWHQTKAFLLAVESGYKEFCDYLIQLGVSPDIEDDDKTALEEATRSNNVEMMKFLIDRGADTNGINSIGTPIHYAADQGNAEGLKLLIEAGADVNQIEQFEDESPLTRAILSGSVESVKLLLDNGADMNYKRGYDGADALIAAVYSQSIGIAEILLKAGADPTGTKDNEGYTAYDYAKMYKDKEMIKMMEKYR